MQQERLSSAANVLRVLASLRAKSLFLSFFHPQRIGILIAVTMCTATATANTTITTLSFGIFGETVLFGSLDGSNCLAIKYIVEALAPPLGSE